MTNEYSRMWRRVFRLSATFLIVFAALISCKKKDSSIGNSVLNQNDLLNSAQVDTFSLTTYTILEDSAITDNPAYAVLGSYNDPKFGTVDAGFYTQFRLSGVNPNFGTAPISIDSIVLGLEYVNYYGDLSSQTVEVYQMTEDIDLDSTYYAFTTKANNGIDLVEPGYGTFTPDPDGITIIGEDTVDTQLRIRLKNSLAQALIAEASSGGANFTTNENFVSYFKGLNVRVNNGAQASGRGGIFYFNLNDPLSKMTIYYEQDGTKKRFDFLINSECADFNHVAINNTGKPVQSVINDTISGQKEFYAQAFKSRAVVRIPGLQNLPEKAVIHKAQLVLPIQYQNGAKYQPADELSVSVFFNGSLSGIGVFGFYDYSFKQYTVDVRNYVQAFVANEVISDELILSPRLFITSAERVIFNGPETINKMKPKLIVTYTEF
ncbi:MAG: DUF4270 family protein [Flavobacteriia bacterium]|jgi:hypothetical protein